MRVVKFEPAHLALIEAAGGREVFGPFPFQPGYGEMCAEWPSWSVFDDDQILACGGISQDHEQCGTAWTLLLPVTSRHMRGIHRLATYALNSVSYRRLQAHASTTFKPAMRWLRMLGFKYEGTLRKFTPAGNDVALYARVR